VVAASLFYLTVLPYFERREDERRYMPAWSSWPTG
jgi:hypothetical protein